MASPRFGTSFSRRAAFQYDGNALDTLICRYSAQERERGIHLSFAQTRHTNFSFSGALSLFFIRQRAINTGKRTRRLGSILAYAGNSSWKSRAPAASSAADGTITQPNDRWNDASSAAHPTRAHAERQRAVSTSIPGPRL